MQTTKQFKAENWNFNFNSVTEEDKEFLLRNYHGDEWYETMLVSDRESWDVMLYMELNALLANGLIKTGFQEYVNMETGETASCYEVFTYKGLVFSDNFMNNYIQRTDGESEAVVVDAETNEEIHDTLLKYRFW